MPSFVDSLLDAPAIAYGDGIVVAYPAARIIEFCDMRIYPADAAELINTLWKAAQTPRAEPRRNIWRITPSRPESEVGAFCIESGDEHAVAYLDDVELSLADIKLYEHHLSQAIRNCLA